MLTKANIRARVEELTAAQFERVGLTTDRVYDVLASIVNGNISRYGTIDDDGHVVFFPWTHFPEHAFECVSEISETVMAHGGTKRLKMFDKLEALALVAKLKGMADEGVSDEERARSIRDHLEELRKATRGWSPDRRR